MLLLTIARQHSINPEFAAKASGLIQPTLFAEVLQKSGFYLKKGLEFSRPYDSWMLALSFRFPQALPYLLKDCVFLLKEAEKQNNEIFEISKCFISRLQRFSSTKCFRLYQEHLTGIVSELGSFPKTKKFLQETKICHFKGPDVLIKTGLVHSDKNQSKCSMCNEGGVIGQWRVEHMYPYKVIIYDLLDFGYKTYFDDSFESQWYENLRLSRPLEPPSAL